MNLAPREYYENSYADYQKRYRSSPPARDVVMLELLKGVVGDREAGTLLDIGCHNGNLLAMVKRELPAWELHGADIWPAVIEDCVADPDLTGIDFREASILSLPWHGYFDVVIANAVLYSFDDDDYLEALKQVAMSLRPGGAFIALDWYHQFQQSLETREFTPEHPDGVTLFTRSWDSVSRTLDDAGLSSVEFVPFEIPYDLELSDPGDALHTHTRTLADGRRLQFRGSIHQPWCYLVART